MKKILTLVMVSTFLFSLGLSAMAEGKTVYIEYEKEKDVDDFGPTVGFDWGVTDRLTLSISRQLEGDGDNEAATSLGVEYGVLAIMPSILSTRFLRRVIKPFSAPLIVSKNF